MNLGRLHSHLTSLNLTFSGLSEGPDKSVVVSFPRSVSSAVRRRVYDAIAQYKEPTKEEDVAHMRRNKDALLERLLIQTFYP